MELGFGVRHGIDDHDDNLTTLGFGVQEPETRNHETLNPKPLVHLLHGIDDRLLQGTLYLLVGHGLTQGAGRS